MSSSPPRMLAVLSAAVLLTILLLAAASCRPAPPGAMLPEYTVTDYGARGDGRFDNAPVLNALLRRLPPQGGVLCFPNGDFRLNSPLVVSSNFVTLRGLNRGWRSNVDGRVLGLAGPAGGSKLLLGPSALAGLLVPRRPRLLDRRADRITDLAIRDLVIQGAGPSAGQTGIDIEQDGDGLVIEDVACVNLGQGIMVKAADASRISGCLIAECRSSLRLEGGKQNLVVQCHLGGQPRGVTCRFIAEDHLLMSACDLFPDGASALRLTAGTFCTISDCLLSGYYTGLVEIDGHDNALLGDSLSAFRKGDAWAPDPAGRNSGWGLVRLSGDDNRFLASTVYSEQPSGDVRVCCVSGRGNRISDVAFSGGVGPRMVVVHGEQARDTAVLNCVTAAQLEVTGDAPQTLLLLPLPHSGP